jgi:hypothetical protein
MHYSYITAIGLRIAYRVISKTRGLDTLVL